MRKGRKFKSPMKPETIELTHRKTNGVAVAQDTPLPHPKLQTRHPKGQPILPLRRYLEDEDFCTSQLHNCIKQKPVTDSQVCFELQARHSKGQPILPPRRYLEDEDFCTSQLHDRTMQKPATDYQVCFELQARHPRGQPILPPRRYLEDEDFCTSQLHNCTMQKPPTDSQVHFEVRRNVVLTHRVPSPTVNENAIYHPLLPKRKVTNESSESNVYQPITVRGTTSKKEEDQARQSATRNENSAYQPLILKSATGNRAQNEERGQLVATKGSSETSHYQPLVYPQERKNPLLHT